MPSFRLRRLFLLLLLLLLSLPVLFLFLLFLSSSASYRTISDLFSTSTHPSELPDEIYGLLHFVTSPDEAGRAVSAVGDPTSAMEQNGPQLGNVIVPEQPVEMDWYALGSVAEINQRATRLWSPASDRGRHWEERVRVLREKYPLVVFSKSYCVYSERAKALLEAYDLSPPPKIIEVDLRVDSSHIKTLLARLTRRSTFPNVILHGRSLGGSDDLVQLHDENRLRQVFEAAGLTVRWTGEGGEGA